MTKDAGHGGPIRELDTWPVDRLEAFTAARNGEELEQVRVIAQNRAYWSDASRLARLRWAKLSLHANERLHGDDPWEQVRMANQAFMLRAWVIQHLGPDEDPDWNPEILATDTLAALTVDPERARTMSANWRDLPIEQIGELRRQKILTAHLDRLVDLLRPGATKDRLVVWAQVRELLP
ncbi:hypothetical protein GCM10010168_78780 [Actinoplanes ianthinogenes]|uniref:Uncharacterized protein n=1 Tax=Actinoplanes ianthinogenes TaxID=122358 RepID=A0ABM7LK81_9ACTN|nr:hypothetical protein [Actinoplanes ianthinogenes]BCJ39667.1 hypothetical protein Aiant_03240 [Actinoplanes ianthinogenes]GGR48232.1 hypothetical protein GCM10010168_78780 [Actinoplanes ianthinogenes]